MLMKINDNSVVNIVPDWPFPDWLNDSSVKTKNKNKIIRGKIKLVFLCPAPASLSLVEAERPMSHYF